MNIPDKISPEELEFLAEGCPHKGITPLDANELIVLARQKVKELNRIVAELDSCTSTTIGGPRWRHFIQARRSIKSAIRNLKRSIAI